MRTDLATRLRHAVVRTHRRLRQEAGADLSPTLLAALGTISRPRPLPPSELAEGESIPRPPPAPPRPPPSAPPPRGCGGAPRGGAPPPARPTPTTGARRSSQPPPPATRCSR